MGDKTSLILAPIAAAGGVPVPMVSGRGLGHTGGTLDKLESIPGFRVDLDLDRYKHVLDECGLVLIGQTAEIAPADKFLYALRDATATVESIPLISASIMSKKLAEGIDGLVLDVKTGDGAFMERLDDSRALARAMCAIGRGLGKRMRALITRMDQPLGRAVGNAVEVAESVECLRGEGPADLMDLSVELAAEMVLMAEVASDPRRGPRALLADDRRRLGPGPVPAGSSPPRGATRTRSTTCRSSPSRRGRSRSTPSAPATSTRSSARPIGQATMLLGAGRARVDSTIDPSVGVILHKKVGDRVEAGEPLCTVLVNDEPGIEDALAMIGEAYRIEDGPVDRRTPDRRADLNGRSAEWGGEEGTGSIGSTSTRDQLG